MPSAISHVVWFKRDLRVQDHAALCAAAEAGPVLPLYVYEPELWAQPDASARQWAFVAETLAALRADLAALGQPLVIRSGDICEVLASLPMAALWSHEETGNAWTFARDQRVAAWARDRGIPWHELQNHGVIRRMARRDGWAEAWDRTMARPVTAPPPALEPLSLDPGAIPKPDLAPDPCPERQPGGRSRGLALLDSFLTTRGKTYRKDMSSPVTGARACSRLSPHLAWGALSMREVAQATNRARMAERPHGTVTAWRGSLKSFSGRLHWHCHFLQKLEDQPDIETRNLHRAYDGLRTEPNAQRLAAWENGETGLPFVDACMRSLRATGWLNFRMRAMVMAVASYHLWLPWRDSGTALARLFTDYEPGIHWSQTQMQSGTTGINTPRIYNPVKQGHDQDPTGAFTRKWVPELAAIDDAHLQQPWAAPNAAQVLDRAYPSPVVDHLAAAKAARTAIWGVRSGAAYRDEAGRIVTKHASRRGSPNRPRKGRSSAQIEMKFDS